MDNRDRRMALAAMFALPVGMAMATEASAAVSKVKAKPMDMAERLDVIESKQAIAELLYAYARANDRADEALLRSCFWPESTHKHGKFDGKSADFVGFAFKIVATLKYACHHISNVSVDVKGDRAFSECYYFAQHRRDSKEGGGEEDVFFQGRYLDDLERRNGEWRIIRRRGLSDYTSAPQPAATPYVQWPAGQHSEKFPSDDYYAMRQQFLGA